MGTGWSSERRARQSAAIHKWRPWERSTGPKTSEGKARVARNAYKGGKREETRALLSVLRDVLDEQAGCLDEWRES
jgi:hypothetical protein